MAYSDTQRHRPSKSMRVVAVLAMIFGLATLFSGGSVLFGPAVAQKLAGDYMPFVVWFNFLAGFFYVAAAIGIWIGRKWAVGLAGAIAVITGLVAVVFGFQIMQGVAFEPRTVGALVLRTGFWATITFALSRTRKLA